jgi:hypothetical protein
MTLIIPLAQETHTPRYLTPMNTEAYKRGETVGFG